MEAKYYTPTIEELHIDFECEIRNNLNDDFHKAKVGLYRTHTLTGGGSISMATLMAYPIEKTTEFVGMGIFDCELDGFIRVKYLDEEDIVACGWEKSEAQSNNYEMPNSVFTKPGLWLTLADGWVEIQTDMRVFFKAKIQINNKSEFKLLMKMLGINGN